jgi:hypothetical protein
MGPTVGLIVHKYGFTQEWSGYHGYEITLDSPRLNGASFLFIAEVSASNILEWLKLRD